MDENDFKRLIDASAAETQRQIAETNCRIDASAAETQRLIAETNHRIDASATETQRLIAETNHRIDASAAETQRRFDETHRLLDEKVKEVRQEFGVVAEGMRNQTQLVAEGVLMLDEKLGREAADIRAEMHPGFADTQAMIRFSQCRACPARTSARRQPSHSRRKRY